MDIYEGGSEGVESSLLTYICAKLVHLKRWYGKDCWIFAIDGEPGIPAIYIICIQVKKHDWAVLSDEQMSNG